MARTTDRQHDPLPRSCDAARRARDRVGRGTAGGFTLLETLIAACVLGLILSAVFGSYRTVTGTITKLEPKIALEQKGRLFVQGLCRQMRCAYGGPVAPVRRSPADSKDAQDSNSAPSSASGEQPPPLFRSDPSSFPEAVLQLVTTSSRLSRKAMAGGLALVSYKVDPARHALLACEELYGRRGNEDDRVWRVVLEDVQGIEFGFFDGLTWQTRWDSNAAGGLPRAVRIKLVLQADPQRPPCCFTSVAALRCGAPKKLDPSFQKSGPAGEKREK